VLKARHRLTAFWGRRLLGTEKRKTDGRNRKTGKKVPFWGKSVSKEMTRCRQMSIEWANKELQGERKKGGTVERIRGRRVPDNWFLKRKNERKLPRSELGTKISGKKVGYLPIKLRGPCPFRFKWSREKGPAWKVSRRASRPEEIKNRFLQGGK